MIIVFDGVQDASNSSSTGGNNFTDMGAMDSNNVNDGNTIQSTGSSGCAATPQGKSMAGGGAAAVASPGISGLSPNTGSTVGGNYVDIPGSGFTDVTGVSFDGIAVSAGNYFVASPAHIAVYLTPGHAAGVVNVKVTASHGVSGSGTTADDYIYVAPAK